MSALFRQELLARLEQTTGQSLRRRADVRALIAALDTRLAEQGRRTTRRWRRAKYSTLLVLLGLAAAQYYVIDLLVQLVSLPQMTFFVPTAARTLHSALALVYFT